MRNILCTLPRKIEKEIKPLIKQVYYASSYEEGLKLGHELIARFKDRYASTMECLEGYPAERLGHATVAFTLDTYSHVVPGLQEAAAKAFDESLKSIAID